MTGVGSMWGALMPFRGGVLRQRVNGARLRLGVWCLKHVFPHVELWFPGSVGTERKVQVILFATTPQQADEFLWVKLGRQHSNHGVTLH